MVAALNHGCTACMGTNTPSQAGALQQVYFSLEIVLAWGCCSSQSVVCPGEGWNL